MFLVGTTTETRRDLPKIPKQVAVGQDPRIAAYYELRERSIQERDAGNLPQVFALCEKAFALATQIGDEALVDQAYGNLFGVKAALGHTDLTYGRLREILLRDRSPRSSFTAAYHLAMSFEMKKEHKKALFYAQIARDRAYALGEVEAIARSHNELGRCFLAESYFDKAVNEYEKGLNVLPTELSATHTALLCNLGYAKLVVKDYRNGFQYLYGGLRNCRRHGHGQVHQEWIHVYLCYGFIELRRWRYAWHHGCSGLQLAQARGSSEAVKSALYLLGELEKSVGDIGAAYDYYSQLQSSFYPENDELAKAMLCCDTRQLVNLGA